MDTNLTKREKEQSFTSGAVHFILSHSYLLFLVAIVLGVVLQIGFPVPLFGTGVYSYLGSFMILGGSGLIYWAQTSSHRSEREMREKNTPRGFDCGPYKYSRNPTHLGLSLMTIGLGIVFNSFFIFICFIGASLISKFIFLRKEEALLEEKYGEPYREYKKKVSTWV